MTNHLVSLFFVSMGPSTHDGAYVSWPVKEGEKNVRLTLEVKH